MKKITFLHCADLHLDSPMKGLKYLPERIFRRLQESTFTALSHLVDLAISHKVDFMIIAGDLFDGENRSISAQARFRKQMDRLREHEIQVYVIHGNHDHLGGVWTNMQWPENVHVFQDVVQCKLFRNQDGTTAHLYGFSYRERHLTEKWIDRYQKVEEADFHIGLLHGHFEGVSDHSRYAPFSLADLAAKQFDYWALGHIHKRTVLTEDPPVIYPGNPQGRNKKESGAKGGYIVTLTESGAEYHFHETNDVLWEVKNIDGSALNSFNDVYQECKQRMEEVRREGKGVVLSLQIQNLPNVEELGFSADLLEVLQEEEKDEQDFVWVRQLEWHGTQQLDRSQVAQGDFFQELFTNIDCFEEWEPALGTLYHHHGARKHLELLTDEDKQELLVKAEAKLIQLLYQE